MNQQINSKRYRIRMVLTKIIQRLRYWKYRIMGYDIDKTTQMERNLGLDKINPKGVHIGGDTIITSGVKVLAHYLRTQVVTDNNGQERTYYKGEKCDTYIGRSCVIGLNAIIMGGVRIGDYCVIGAGSIVTKDVPDRTVVAGNPARIIKEGVVFDGKRI